VRRCFANHMLIKTVAMVRVSHAGMNIAWVFLETSEGPHVRAAKPTMMTVRSKSRRGEDLDGPWAPCATT
jgi:hypothetical protein